MMTHATQPTPNPPPPAVIHPALDRVDFQVDFTGQCPSLPLLTRRYGACCHRQEGAQNVQPLDGQGHASAPAPRVRALRPPPTAAQHARVAANNTYNVPQAPPAPRHPMLGVHPMMCMRRTPPTIHDYSSLKAPPSPHQVGTVSHSPRVLPPDGFSALVQLDCHTVAPREPSGYNRCTTAWPVVPPRG